MRSRTRRISTDRVPIVCHMMPSGSGEEAPNSCRASAVADSPVIAPGTHDVRHALRDILSLRASWGIFVGGRYTGGLILYGPQFPYGSIGQRAIESAGEHRNTRTRRRNSWVGILFHRTDREY